MAYVENAVLFVPCHLLQGGSSIVGDTAIAPQYVANGFTMISYIDASITETIHSSQSDSPGANDSNPIRHRNLCEGIENADRIILLLEKDLESSEGVTRLLTEYVRVNIPLKGSIAWQSFSPDLITTMNNCHRHHISLAIKILSHIHPRLSQSVRCILICQDGRIQAPSYGPDR